MYKLYDIVEKMSAIGGAAMCLMAGIIRLTGTYHAMGVQVMTMFSVGIALMVLAILLKLHMNDMK